VNNLKARLQRTGTPRRESPGVGAGAEEQVAKLVCSTSVILESLSRDKWLSGTEDEVVNSWTL